MAKLIPMLFNTDMVRAILDDRKTVTRRVVKLPKWIVKQDDGSYTMFAEGTCYEKQCFEEIATYLNRPYRRGDVLYVRETWCDDRQYTKDDTPGIYFYKANEKNDYNVKWHPSIHMPKEAARIFLKVTDVGVEQLQDITSEQAVREGTKEQFPPLAVDEFRDIWNSTIKKSDLKLYGWDANPWVWVIEFERCEKLEEVPE